MITQKIIRNSLKTKSKKYKKRVYKNRILRNNYKHLRKSSPNYNHNYQNMLPPINNINKKYPNYNLQ